MCGMLSALAGRLRAFVGSMLLPVHAVLNCGSEENAFRNRGAVGQVVGTAFPPPLPSRPPR